MTPEEIEALVAKNKALEDQLESAETIIGDQSKKIEGYVKNDKTIKPTVKVAAKEYRILHGVNFDGKVYSAQDIAENADVAAKLLNNESSALELVAEETE